MNRRGFTLIELLVVVTIIGVLTNIAVPAVQGVRKRAQAAAVLGEFIVIRGAAYDHFADTGTYPKSSGWGTVPPELVGSLPENYSFAQNGITFRWRRWSLPNGLPRNRRQTRLLGVQVRADDRQVLQVIRNLFQGASGNNRTVTLVIE